MPETVTTTIAVSAIRKGDRIETGNGVTEPVAHSKRGTKYLTFTDANGALVARMDLGTTAAVQRVQDTKEEQAAAWRRRRVERIADWLTTDDLTGAIEKMTERITKGGYHNNHDVYDAVLYAEAETQIKRTVQNLLDSNEGFDPADAFDQWSEYAKKNYMNRYNHRALSRSTSVTSNLIDDVQREVTFRLLDDWMLRAVELDD